MKQESPKPTTVIDVINHGGIDSFSRLEKRISFDDARTVFTDKLISRSKPVIKGLVLALVVGGLLGAGVSAPAPHGSGQLLAAGAITASEREALEEELRQVESQISAYQVTIDDLKGQTSSLKNELRRLDAKIAQINLRIKATRLSLAKLNQEIEETQDQISVTEGEIQFSKGALANSLRKIYQEESITVVELLLRQPKFSDFFGELNSLLVIQDSTRQTLQKVTQLKNQLLDQRETLALERSDVIALKKFNESQKVALNDTRSRKDDLLQKTKGEESKYQDLLKDSIKTASEIRTRIFSLLGGGELTFERAVELAKLAEASTGIRAALLLAILDRESSLGKNVGKCPYYDAKKDRYYMHPRRDVPLFLEITEELGIDPLNTLVSCPNSDGAYGGAMGPSQFIPSTWNIYRKKISEYGGGNPPSPWNNTDAFLATALFLKDLRADRGTLSAEREAAARYYAGGRWRRYVWTYGDWVVSKAQSYQKDINILDG